MTATDVLPASMFIPVPGPDRESQNTPHATANSNSEDTKKQVGQYLTVRNLEVTLEQVSFFIHETLLKCSWNLESI